MINIINKANIEKTGPIVFKLKINNIKPIRMNL